MPRHFSLGAAALPLLLAACSESRISRPIPLHAPIGPEGGELVIGIGEVSLTVPPGALDHDVYVSVAEGESEQRQGWRVVGKAYAFAPPETTFTKPADVVVSYETRLVSLIIDPAAEIRVGYVDAGGKSSELVPDYVDPGSGRVTVATKALGTFWVLAPDVVSAPIVFPLNRGNNYHFDSGLVVTVDRKTDEPNFASMEIVKVTFTEGERTWGIYLDDTDGRMSQRGWFDDPGYQEVYALPVPLIGDRDTLGTLRPAAVTYTAYRPFGATTAAYQGLAQVSCSIADHHTILSAVGGFDTVRVPITTVLRGEAERTQTLELFLAQGTGPVAITVGSGARSTIVSGTVRNRPIVGF